MLSENVSGVIDCHVHVWPDSLVKKNLDMISKASGITPAYDGSITSLRDCMSRSKVSLSLINNVVLRSELVKKANDWTAEAVSKRNDLVGIGWLMAGNPESVEEAERCALGLGFKGFKMHHSHMKILPDGPKNTKIYEKISELKLPVLFHCGRNPYARDSEIQFSTPEKFDSVLSSFDKMKVILGHLAGVEDDPENAFEILRNHKNVVADTAIDFSKGEHSEVKKMVGELGISRLVFGSDFPIHDPFVALNALRGMFTISEFETLAYHNPKAFFQL